MTGRLRATVRRTGSGVVARRTQRTHPQRAVRAEVSRVVDLTPTMRRVTFTGPDLAEWPVAGYDHYVRVLLPVPGQPEPVLPATSRWYPELLAMDVSVRPRLRNYTLRDVRPHLREADVDFVVHHHGGPAATWAGAAEPGDVVGLVEQGTLWTPDPATGSLLVVADDTGVPAALSILEQLPAHVAVTAFLEVTSPQDEQPAPPGREVTWLHRGDPLARPGRLLLEQVPQHDAAVSHAWLAGESAMVTGLRRHLVRDRGVAKADISFTGYFRHGRAAYSD